MNCPYDVTHEAVRFGTYKEKQLWWCPICRRKFRDPMYLFGQHHPKRYIVEALTFYYNGMSYRNVAHTLQDLHGVAIPKMTFWRWVVAYTAEVNRYVDSLRPRVGTVWVADETVIKIAGEDWWYWDLIDYETRYLIATHLSKTRGVFKATKLMQQARRRTGAVPTVIMTDQLQDYHKGIANVFRAEVHHLTSEGFGSHSNINLIERFHGTIKQRTKIMRHMKRHEAASIVLDGFVVDYNFLKEHSHLDNTPPARVAGLGAGIRNWGDLIDRAMAHAQGAPAAYAQPARGYRALAQENPGAGAENLQVTEW
mgnify:CR=1 FL=1